MLYFRIHVVSPGFDGNLENIRKRLCEDNICAFTYGPECIYVSAEAVHRHIDTLPTGQAGMVTALCINI